MSTIKDVAARAGVAVGTVSHVITGSVRVSEPLRRKVQAAIRDLDYHPNHVARSLKTSRTRTLGIVVPDVTISFYPQVIHGAEQAARAHNYSLISVNSADDGKRQEELLSLLRSQRVEGILLVPAAGSQPPVTQVTRMMEAGIAVVCLDRIPDKMKIDSVTVEDVSAARMGVAHLIAQGNRRIAVVAGPPALRNERGRLNGYKKALADAGIPVEEELIWYGNLRPEEIAAMCVEKLREASRLPDAIFATNGQSGLGVLRALRQCGLRTPDDIAFATFDELSVDDLFSPSITTVVQPAGEIGVRATEILLQRIQEGVHGGAGSPLTVRLPATLKTRESSARPAASRRSRASRVSGR